MRIDISKLDPSGILDRICQAYGFQQKVQLANHFDIAASSLSNRYTRGTISYDLAALCTLETGASLSWILTGKGERFTGEGIVIDESTEVAELNKFTLSEGVLHENGFFSIDRSVLEKDSTDMFCVDADSKIHFIERTTLASDGLRLVDIDGSVSIREIAVLPAKRLHVTGGKVPFECSVDDIKILGRIIGVYSEVN